MLTEATVTTDIIIRGDEAFKQEIYLTPLGSMDDMIQAAFKEDKYSFVPIVIPPLMSQWVLGHYLGTPQNGEDLLCFTEIEYFPFKGGHLFKQNGMENHTLVTPPQYEDSTTIQEHESYKEIDLLKWKIPTDYRGFILSPFKERQLRSPYFFLIKRDYSECVIPNIPNVYDSGKICTGDSYKNRNDSDIATSDNAPLHHIKYGLNILHEAKCNNDLRHQTLDQQFMQWNEDGTSVVTQFDTSRAGIAEQVTDVRVVEFFKWMIQKQGVLSA